MASNPNEPPESIIVGQFSGIKNTVSRERLKVGELEAAVNVDIDDAGQLRRRRGYDQKLAGYCHSLWSMPDGRALIVYRDDLGILQQDYLIVPLVTGIGPDPLSYTAVGETVYFSSRSASGKIVDDAVLPWGQTGGEGQWLSPVIRPTETLGAISGKLLGPPPLATEIESYKGRIYLASERWLWATELYLYDLVDRTKNYLQFEHDITMVRAVDSGLFVGTTAQLLFLQGTLSEGFKRSVVLESPVIPGSAVVVPTADVHPQARESDTVPESNSPVFLTGQGICVGLDDGQVINLTRKRVVFPEAVRAAALYREDQGANSYVAVTDSAGGPSANARIGDYVDAEIVRASQGG